MKRAVIFYALCALAFGQPAKADTEIQHASLPPSDTVLVTQPLQIGRPLKRPVDIGLRKDGTVCKTSAHMERFLQLWVETEIATEPLKAIAEVNKEAGEKVCGADAWVITDIIEMNAKVVRGGDGNFWRICQVTVLGVVRDGERKKLPRARGYLAFFDHVGQDQ